ncbi:MAG: ATP-binding cassette domain-containing protein [Mailhella sp.]|nr:ATP-binding cassette domain-containing protein [Mailhella sp.]
MTRCMLAEGLSLRREKNGSSFTLTVPRLEVSCGQTLAVVGTSGCGKSTLLDMLALILRPGSAERFTLELQGKSEDLFAAGPSRLAQIRGSHIGYVLQSGGLLSFLSVRDNILLPGRLLGLPPASLVKRADELGERLGISGQMQKKPQHLSGGQRQRVAIARALIHNPALVLADEPTAAVDQASAEDICAVFKSVVRESGAALVIVSHDRPLMERMADTMVTFRVEKPTPVDACSTLVPQEKAL